MNSGETVMSVLTPTGRGAVAVVAVLGPEAVAAVGSFFLAKNRRALTEQPLARIVYGHWGSHEGEDLIVCRRDANGIEIHCHGGSQSVAKIASDLSTAGCREIPWQEGLSRQNECPLQVEAQIALAQAASQRTAAILLDQFHGALRREILAISELLENKNVVAAQQKLTAILATAPLGLHLTRPWQVVIAGKPNVGKSSLINALVGYRRAIVFDQPGTTRDVVTTSTVVEGWPVTLSDTAGLHEAGDELEAAGIELAKERLASADLVVWVLDATEPRAGALQEMVNREVAQLALSLPKKRLLVLNKRDLVDEMGVSDDAIATSAVTGAGIERLLAAIVSSLVPSIPEPGTAVLFTPRQHVAIESVLAACQQRDANGAAEWLAKLLRM